LNEGTFVLAKPFLSYNNQPSAFRILIAMVQYSLPQNPDVIINVSGKDSDKTREKAMEQLIQMIEEGEIPANSADGFGPQQFVELKEPGTLVIGSEDALNQAVQILSSLATLKLKAQESREEAMKIRQKIDILFTDEDVSEAEIIELKDSFKILKSYAQANMRYRAARAQAEMARAVIDEALKPPEAEVAVPDRSKTTEPEAASAEAGAETEAEAEVSTSKKSKASKK
jgi:hypothetical protein